VFAERRSWLAPREDIECSAYRSQSAPPTVTAEGFADGLDVRPMLKREGQEDRRVTRVGVGLISKLVIVQEQFGYPAIAEFADCRSEAQAGYLECE
jgi:hypothetical protein